MEYATGCFQLLATSFVADCAPTQSSETKLYSAPEISTSSCNDRSTGICNFINSPVKFGDKVIELPGRDFPFSLTVEPLTFVDAKKSHEGDGGGDGGSYWISTRLTKR